MWLCRLSVTTRLSANVDECYQFLKLWQRGGFELRILYTVAEVHDLDKQNIMRLK